MEARNAIFTESLGDSRLFFFLPRDARHTIYTFGKSMGELETRLGRKGEGGASYVFAHHKLPCVVVLPNTCYTNNDLLLIASSATAWELAHNHNNRVSSVIFNKTLQRAGPALASQAPAPNAISPPLLCSFFSSQLLTHFARREAISTQLSHLFCLK